MRSSNGRTRIKQTVSSNPTAEKPHTTSRSGSAMASNKRDTRPDAKEELFAVVNFEEAIDMGPHPSRTKHTAIIGYRKGLGAAVTPITSKVWPGSFTNIKKK
jgi:hypothetical protein